MKFFYFFCMPAEDYRPVLKQRLCPGECDIYAPRDVSNCKWPKNVIGLPSVVKVGNRLALFYDGPAEDSLSHMRRDIGLAWIPLPLRDPGAK